MKKMHPYPVAVALTLALAACNPPIAEYTETEAPKQLTLDDAAIKFDFRFPPGSSRLAAGDVARLRALAARGSIAASDRVLVSVGGSPGLAEARTAAIAAELLRYGIVVNAVQRGNMAPDRAGIEVVRYLVTLPPCPNWSKEPANDFTNTLGSNYGCATVSNLGRMVANPADLASGQPLGLASGKPATDAVHRYRFDIDPAGPGVKPLLGATTSTAAAAPAGGAGAGGAGGGAAGGSTGSEE
jgi:pilus assembly protein CpaD